MLGSKECLRSLKLTELRADKKDDDLQSFFWFPAVNAAQCESMSGSFREVPVFAFGTSPLVITLDFSVNYNFEVISNGWDEQL